MRQALPVMSMGNANYSVSEQGELRARFAPDCWDDDELESRASAMVFAVHTLVSLGTESQAGR